MEQIIAVLINKLCHDLNNHINLLNMSLELDDLELLEESLNTHACYINLIKCLKNDQNFNQKHMEKYIKIKEEKINLNFYEEKLSILYFYLMEKNQNIEINEDQIEILNYNLNQKEMSYLQGNFSDIDENNIILYLAYLKYQNYCKIEVINLEDKCIIIIKKLLN